MCARQHLYQHASALASNVCNPNMQGSIIAATRLRRWCLVSEGQGACCRSGAQQFWLPAAPAAAVAPAGLDAGPVQTQATEHSSHPARQCRCSGETGQLRPATELAVNKATACALWTAGNFLALRDDFGTRGVGPAGNAGHPHVIVEAALSAMAASAGRCIRQIPPTVWCRPTVLSLRGGSSCSSCGHVCNASSCLCAITSGSASQP